MANNKDKFIVYLLGFTQFGHTNWYPWKKFQEVFEESKCGKCGSENLKFVVRTVDDNEYFELRCMDCGAKLAFGSMKKGGGLFPKRKDGDNWLPDNGWTKWNPKTKQAE